MKTSGFVHALLILTLAGPITIACGGGGGSAAKPVSATLDDATITTRVKTAILNDPGVPGQKIDVNASAGVVTLAGVVKTKEKITPGPEFFAAREPQIRLRCTKGI